MPLKNLAQSFIRQTFTVNLVCAFLLVSGYVAFKSLKRDLIPQWEIKSIQVSGQIPGASALQIEKNLVYPIEEVLKNFSEVEEMNSESSNGSGFVNLQLKESVEDTEDLLRRVKDAVNNIRGELPRDVENLMVMQPKITEIWLGLISILNFDETNELHRKWIRSVEERFRLLTGMAKVNAWYRNPELNIKMDQNKLARYRLRPEYVRQKVQENFTLFPMGGVRKGGKDINFELKTGQKNIENIKELTLLGNSSGAHIALKDVAEVTLDLKKRDMYYRVNGKPANVMVLQKDLESDSIDLLAQVKKELKSLNADPNKPSGIELLLTGDAPSFIERQLITLKNNAILGLVLVFLTLWLFLGAKISLLTTFSIPLAYLATMLVLSFMGLKIDLISVVGLLLILGILVDDAIIVAEQYTQNLEKGMSPYEAAKTAIGTTIKPVTGTILTTVVAFAPILFLKNELARIMYAIPVVVIASLTMSWIESFFILPNHLTDFIKRAPKDEGGGKFMGVLKGIYHRLLQFSLSFRYPLMVLLVAGMGYSMYFAYRNIPMKFNMNIGSEKIKINMVLKKSDSMEQTEKEMQPVVDLIQGLDKSRFSHFDYRIGKTRMNQMSYDGPQYAQMDVRFSQTDTNLKENKDYVEGVLEKALPALQEQNPNFETLSYRRSQQGDMNDTAETISISIKSRERADFNQLVQKVKESIKGAHGLKDIFLDPNLGQQTYRFEVSEPKMKELGLETNAVYQQLRDLLTVNNFYDYKLGEETIPVISSITPSPIHSGKDEQALTLDELNSLKIISSAGQHTIPLKLAGKWVAEETPRNISHKNLYRHFGLNVSFYKNQSRMEEFINKVDYLLDPVREKWTDSTFSVMNADLSVEKNKKSFNRMFLYCILMILFILAVSLGSLVQPLIIASAIPFGIIGVVWAFYFHGATINIMAMIGVIGMAGVVVNDSLILVDTINRNIGLGEYAGFPRAAIVAGAISRLRPILLTSLTTLGGLFPMAYGIGGDAGFTKALALSMGWGLLFATFLTLFLLPSLLLIHLDLMKFLKGLLAKVWKPQEKGMDWSEDLNSV